MPFSRNPDDIGRKLGPKLVALISQAVVSTKVKLLDTEHRARVGSMQEIIDRAGREIADLYRPVWDDAFAETEMPDVYRDHITKIMSGRHQWQAIAGIAFGASGAPNAISTIVSNYLAPGVRTVVSASPELIPTPQEGAQLAARHIIDVDEAASWARGQGFNEHIALALIEGSKSYPDITATIELYRRRVIGQDEFIFYLQRNGLPDSVIGQVGNLVAQLLSPADLADMVVRGIKTEQDAASVAAESGVSSDDFAAMVLDTGEPPGLQQMLEGYRRGFIDQAALEHGIRQSRYRDEWIPLLEQLRFEPMSVADAVNATVQNHITAEEGNRIAEQNGLAPGNFDILEATAGEPLSRTEMSQLVNRGQATEADFIQAMRESRVKDKYIPYAYLLREKVLPIFTLQRALKNGAVDHQTAVTIAMESGYTQRDAEIIVSGGAADKLLPYKNKVVAAIETAFEDSLIQLPDALTLITSMGYERSEADFILQAAEYRQSAKIVTQVSNAVRSRYIQRRIDRNQASADLDAIGVPATSRDTMLALWDIELAANTRHLTEAQVVKAVKKQLITPDDGQARLVAMGYSADDAALLLQEI